MKQILYIPSGRYFLWFDSSATPPKRLPTLSPEELLSKDSAWCLANDITDVETMLKQIIDDYTYFNPSLYEYVGIDSPEKMLISEFEIIEDGK